MGFGASFVRRFGAGGSEPCRWLISERREPKNAEEFYTFYCEVISEIRIAQKPSRLQTILTNLFQRPKPRQTRKPAGRDRTRRTTPDRTRRTTPDRRRTGSRPTARRR